MMVLVFMSFEFAAVGRGRGEEKSRENELTATEKPGPIEVSLAVIYALSLLNSRSVKQCGALLTKYW